MGAKAPVTALLVLVGALLTTGRGLAHTTSGANQTTSMSVRSSATARHYHEKGMSDDTMMLLMLALLMMFLMYSLFMPYTVLMGSQAVTAVPVAAGVPGALATAPTIATGRRKRAMFEPIPQDKLVELAKAVEEAMQQFIKSHYK